MTPRILVVDADVMRGQPVARELSTLGECRLATTAEQLSVALAQGRWAAFVVGYGPIGDRSGIEFLQMARESFPHVFRIFYNHVPSSSFRHDAERLLDPHFVGHASDPDFLAALHHAVEVLFRPVEPDAARELPAEVRELLVGCAPASLRFAQALCAAGVEDAPVYIYGEPGTAVPGAAALLRRMRREHRATAIPGQAPKSPVRILRMPPLRERPQDLAVLAEQWLTEETRQGGGPARRLSPRAQEELLSRGWYGNDRELQAMLARAVHRAGARAVIEAEDLPRDSQPCWRPSQFAKDAGQRDCVLRQLRLAQNVSAAARLEGCSRANYIRLMRRLGIVRADLALAEPQSGE